MTHLYWDRPWSLVDGCTPCSPGCDHCWSAAMTHRFYNSFTDMPTKQPCLLRVKDGRGVYNRRGYEFSGNIIIHPERLSIPLKRRKPTVYAVWNDWAHESISHHFRSLIVKTARECPQHIILALTKRPVIAVGFWDRQEAPRPPENWWTGLTVCNQLEADEKIPIFLQVPGNKFLSIEPMLGPIDINEAMPLAEDGPNIDAVIVGGETGPGARPIYSDWVRSVRDQCAVADVPFFFKQWGSYKYKGSTGRILDGRTHDNLPWRSKEEKDE